MGVGTGAVGFGISWGCDFLPISALWRTVAFGGVGTLGALALGKMGDLRLGAAMGAATGFGLAGRITTLVKTAQIAPSASTSTTPTETSGVRVMREGGRVYSRADAGRVYARETGAPLTMGRQVFGKSFKETGASQFVRGPVRFFGPNSWAANNGGREGGAVVRYVSKHSPSNVLR
jgi:hypothetical protein